MFLDSVFNYIFENIFATFLQLALYKKFPRELAERKKCLNDLIERFQEAPNLAPNERYCYIEATSPINKQQFAKSHVQTADLLQSELKRRHSKIHFPNQHEGKDHHSRLILYLKQFTSGTILVKGL